MKNKGKGTSYTQIKRCPICITVISSDRNTCYNPKCIKTFDGKIVSVK